MFGKLHCVGKSRLRVTHPESVYFYTLHKCASSLFSDKPGGYVDKLPRSTIEVLNITFAPILTRFDYEA